MRMSRRMGMFNSDAMYPDSVTVNSGSAKNYWASSSGTSDKWHKTLPFSNEYAYFGRNPNQVYHNAALCFKTGSFTGKGKRISIKFYGQYTYNTDGCAFACQLSKHNWSTTAAWSAGSKSKYSSSMTSLPSDPNAIGKKSGTFPYGNSTSVTVTIDAEILPNTEYVLYIIGTSGTSGHIVTMTNTQPVITITG